MQPESYRSARLPDYRLDPPEPEFTDDAWDYLLELAALELAAEGELDPDDDTIEDRAVAIGRRPPRW